MVREIWFQSQVVLYQRFYKWYLIYPSLTLSNIRLVSRVTWSNPGKGVAPSCTRRCSSYWKGNLLVTFDYDRYNFTTQQISVGFDSKCWGSRINWDSCIAVTNNALIPASITHFKAPQAPSNELSLAKRVMPRGTVPRNQTSQLNNNHLTRMPDNDIPRLLMH